VNSVYTVTVTDNCNTPANEANIYITVSNEAPIEVSPLIAEGCKPFQAYFAIDNYNASFTYEWNFGEKWQSFSTNDSVPHEFKTVGCNDITVRSKTEIGCETVKTFKCITNTRPVPKADFSYSPFSPTILEPAVDFRDESEGATQVAFWIDSVFQTNERGFTYNFPTNGQFEVVQVAENSFQCADTTVSYVRVEEASTIYIPTAFTPNGDNLNEFFSPVTDGVRLTDFNMLIYDRWGNLVFETNDLNEPWNGTLQNSGEKLPTGNYIYYIRYSEHDNQDKYIHGKIELIR